MVKLDIGSFSYVADPTDRTRCSDKCPWIRQAQNPLDADYKCQYFSGVQLTNKKRLQRCLDSEKHESERPAKWISRRQGGALCSFCEHHIFGYSANPTICPGCHKKMMQDDET